MNNNNYKRDYKQPGKHWCKFCNIFVYNNASCLKKHDSSPQHQANVERFIKETKKQEEIKKRFTSSAGPERSEKPSYYSTQSSTQAKKEIMPSVQKSHKSGIIGFMDDDDETEAPIEISTLDNANSLPTLPKLPTLSTPSNAEPVSLPFVQRRKLVAEVEDEDLPVQVSSVTTSADNCNDNNKEHYFEEKLLFKKRKY